MSAEQGGQSPESDAPPTDDYFDGIAWAAEFAALYDTGEQAAAALRVCAQTLRAARVIPQECSRVDAP